MAKNRQTKNKQKALEWPSQNLTKMLWHDLK